MFTTINKEDHNMKNNQIKTVTQFLVFDKDGRPNGYFLGNEEELCKAYCEMNDCTYRREEVRA